jgi:hypothetical protein
MNADGRPSDSSHTRGGESSAEGPCDACAWIARSRGSPPSGSSGLSSACARRRFLAVAAHATAAAAAKQHATTMSGTSHFSNHALGVGGGDLQVVMQSPGDSKPLGSSLHWPAVVSQLYITGMVHVMLPWPPQLHLSAPCGVCVGHDAEQSVNVVGAGI